MSLIRLLAVGRTLKGIRDESHRYRDITGRNLLPKFGASGSDALFAPNGRASAVQQASLSVVPPTSAIAKPTQTEQARSPENSVEMAAELETASLARGSSQRSRWFLAKSLLAKGALTAKTRASVSANSFQGQLSLDKVKVVRNDLSDADLEVVPALRPGAMGREESTSAKAPKRDMVPSVWSRATASLFAAMPF